MHRGQQREAAAGQPDVEQHDVDRAPRREQRPGVGDRVRHTGHDKIVLGGQTQRQKIGERPVIVHQEYPHHA
ncbi:hypothetical protein Pdca_36650 [Pseudonocardia autotrophica]|nr:hypothetical protein Pdca_36650 [Pseudonocardia autotrophica]